MTFASQLERLIADTLDVSLPAFGVELVVCATILVLLLGRLFAWDRTIGPRWVAMLGSVVAFVLACIELSQQFNGQVAPPESTPIFTGLLVNDSLTVFMRFVLTLVLLITVWLTAISGIPDREDGPDFYSLLLGSLLGSLLMCQANHMAMVFLSIEMASVPGYVLVGFQKGRRQSGESALKYLVYGAGAAGILLYGVSLLCGATGAGSLEAIGDRLPAIFEAHSVPLADPLTRSVLLGLVFTFVGLAFKLALVPFHFWCPDAFEGASAEVAGFLSVAPKAAAFALMTRMAVEFFDANSIVVEQFRMGFGLGLAVLAALTMTIGNLIAFTQKDMKRLFAYSTIAQAGYLLMGLTAWMVGGTDSGRVGVEGMLYYLVVYAFMNLGAFGVIAAVRNRTFREDITSFQGLGYSFPVLAAVMVICCISLIGIWPAGGFIGKFMVFGAAVDAGWTHSSMWILVGVAVINTVWSVFYYARVIVAMYSQSEIVVDTSGALPMNYFAVTMAVAVLGLGLVVAPFSRMAAFVARSLLP